MQAVLVHGELRNEIMAAFKKICGALKKLPTFKQFDEQAQDEVKIARPATRPGVLIGFGNQTYSLRYDKADGLEAARPLPPCKQMPYQSSLRTLSNDSIPYGTVASVRAARHSAVVTPGTLLREVGSVKESRSAAVSP
jgi:hypothetical protein